jgi:3-phosphoshikimate 1-carboxyvinyltransferase
MCAPLPTPGMDVRIAGSAVGGTASAPPSKSYTHRAVLAAGLGSETVVEHPLASADTRATAGAVEAFGGSVAGNEEWTVTGFGGRPSVPADVIDCGNSGTTIRLASAVAALADGTTVLTGDDSLRSRPHGPLLSALRDLGARAESTRSNGQAPLVVEGPIGGGTVSLPGDVSSQFVTALLFAGAATEEGIDVELTTPLKSAPYVEITRELLAAFGVETRETGDGYAVSGGQAYDCDAYAVPGDFSSISYLLAAGATAAPDGLTVENARPSAQGDAAIVDVLERMGAPVEWDREAGRIHVSEAPLSGVTVDVGDTPDLLPTIATLGAVADGETRIENCEHVRYKETDRVAAMATELERMGATVTEREDVLLVDGDDSELVGCRVDGHADHRIVMALSVAALAAAGTTTVAGGEHVDVSFPGFFDVLDGLGAAIDR